MKTKLTRFAAVLAAAALLVTAFGCKGAEDATVETAATPVISDVTDNKVTISCETEGATIHYTTDGTDPTTDSSVYEAAITLTASVTIKAIAVADGYNNSTITSKDCTYTAPTVATPVIGDVTDNTVTITCATSGAKIYYTINGDEPTASSTEYTAAITLTETVTIKAIAVATGYANSEVASKACTYTAPTASTPVITNTDNSITITSETEGAVIYYTTNGDDPTTESTKYEAAFAITSTVTVKAIATKTGYTD